MNSTKLIIFDFQELYKIFEELNNFYDLDFKNISNQKDLNDEIKNIDDYLIISKKNQFKFKNQIYLNDLPIKFSKILEKINIQILKNSYSNKSNISVGNYKIDLNSRTIFKNDKSLKLTEKEVKIIIYISEVNKSVSISELQQKIWDYNAELETHTVETHVHRLRKKIQEYFNDKNFIISTKDGYKIF
tara:strand:+ start:44 stop:607 length:564 start_codon:yes stop_codon:yes gene_type:complete